MSRKLARGIGSPMSSRTRRGQEACERDMKEKKKKHQQEENEAFDPVERECLRWAFVLQGI